MKGDPRVMEALQKAINLETGLSNLYFVNGLDQKRFGLKTGGELCELGEQTRKFAEMQVKRLLFLEGEPVIAPSSADTGTSLEATLRELLAAEMNILATYAQFVRVFWEAGDFSNFHLFQHLIRWHREGQDTGTDFKGHVAYLQKELWQITQLGETDYIAAHL